MGRHAELTAEAEAHGYKLVPAYPDPDEIAENHMGGALMSLQLARNAVRDGGVYPKADCIATARALLDEIEASAHRKREAA